MKYVIKRNGDKVRFYKKRIVNAIIRANKDIPKDKQISKRKINVITNIIVEKLDDTYKDSIPNVEDIQNLVEKYLVSEANYELAKSYIIYRYVRSEIRERNRDLALKVKNRAEGKVCLNANANVDEISFSGREKEASADVSKAVALEYGGLSETTAKNHKEMIVYQHDLEKAIYGVHNCLYLNFQKVFQKVVTRNTDLRIPASFATACQLVAVDFQLQSQIQFGGVATIHLDYDLAPYVDKSFKKLYMKAVVKDSRDFTKLKLYELSEYEFDKWVDDHKAKYLKKKNITINDIYIDNKKKLKDKYFKQAMFDLMIEGRQSCEALYHNLNSLESRSGSQVPFTSINLGRDTSTEGRLVNQWIFEASLNGVGEHHNTSIFPISIFQWKQGCNANPEDKNYDLKRLAIKSLTRRIYPNWINCDWSQAHEDLNDIDTYFSSMGCRTLVGYDINGLGYKRQGRGNAVPNTIILPKLGIKHGICLGKRTEPDINGFWKEFENVLLETEQSLLERFAIISQQSPKSAPFMYINGSAVDTENCKDNVYNTMKHFSLAIGYVGIAEMCQAMFGKDHADGDEEVYKFALSVVKRINEFAKEATERNKLNFAAYATPAETLVYKAAKELRKQYGVIKNVTDRDYLTNSHHVPVWKKVTIYDKLRLEAPFTKYPTAGCITYIELDSTCMENEDAIEAIIDYAFKELDIPYLAFNFPIDTCNDCGHQAEMNGICLVCGSKNITSLRRVTGYITQDYHNFNPGKVKETEDRIKHSQITGSEDWYPNYDFLDKYIKKVS